MLEHMDRNQVGYVMGMTTHVNIVLFTNQIQARLRDAVNNKSIIKKHYCLIFIDFKSAYNTIIRKKIYDILKRKNILTDEETLFLELLHDKLYFENKDKKYYFPNGVHQGSPLSPALFNIYLEEFLGLI